MRLFGQLLSRGHCLPFAFTFHRVHSMFYVPVPPVVFFVFCCGIITPVYHKWGKLVLSGAVTQFPVIESEEKNVDKIQMSC